MSSPNKGQYTLFAFYSFLTRLVGEYRKLNSVQVIGGEMRVIDEA